MVASPDTAGDMDWRSGTWACANAAQSDLEVMITGDWAPIRDFADIIVSDPLAVYGDLLPAMHAADLRITNLECPLTDRTDAVWKSGTELKGSPDHIKGLTAAGFDAVTLGNNHVFDFGVDAFDDTTWLLDQANIEWVGAGHTVDQASQPLVMEKNGIRLGVLNFSEGEDLTAAGTGPGVLGWEVDRMADAIVQLKRQGCVVVVICHCGVEYIAFPPPYVVHAFRRMATAGADLVVGHHPHVPQGIEIHNGVPICYCLGNFVFYQATDLYWRKVGYMVRAGFGASGLAALSIIPYAIGASGLSLLRGDDLRHVLARLEGVSSPLATEAGVQAAWHAFLKRYGTKGFEEEIALLMDTFNARPQKGAAMFRNRVATLQHRHHWIDALTRIIDGTIDDAPQWAMELTQEWLTRKR